MLTDPKAIEIISGARQPNVARPDVPDAPFDNILADFFTPEHFAGRAILELGPGHCDFARRAADLGATVDVVDSDPAVLELARYLGLGAIEANLMHWVPPAGKYGGLFCKGSLSAFWGSTPEQTAAWTRALCGVLRPSGWGWVAPWNGGGSDVRFLDAQAAAFLAAGWVRHDVGSDDAQARYGLIYDTANHPLYTRGL